MATSYSFSPNATISSDLTILGDLSTSGSVTIDGVIEGNIKCTSLIVTANGRVNGGVVAVHEVIVRGEVTGAIRCRCVTLQSSAKVEGDISYHRISIGMGARYAGRLRWMEDEQDSPMLGEQENSGAAYNAGRIGDPPTEPQLPKRPAASNEGRIAAERLTDGHVANQPDDEMHEPRPKASGARGPNQRFSMHNHEQKRYREDDLRHESGARLPAE